MSELISGALALALAAAQCAVRCPDTRKRAGGVALESSLPHRGRRFGAPP